MPKSHPHDRDLYPATPLSVKGTFHTDDGHEIYWEAIGPEDGIPVMFLHGGPGGGLAPTFRRFFDPGYYRVILMDQRGCGQSLPHASIENNTTTHLISDIESLREIHGVDQWVVFGGSWGSTLALTYAQAHPDRCLHLVLRGIFLGQDYEIDWFMKGMGSFFPETEQAFITDTDGTNTDGTNTDGKNDLQSMSARALLEFYYAKLIDPDPEVHMPAALTWANYEGDCASLVPSPQPSYTRTNSNSALAIARLEAHYFAHGLFLGKDADGKNYGLAPILENMDKLASIPGTIIQGRYDVICPPVTAWKLAQAWPKAELRIIADAGHSSMETGIRKALVGTMERLKVSLKIDLPSPDENG
jgi:proline iminopeptidase